MILKYVVIQYKDNEFPIQFPKALPHETFAKFNPISAGFVDTKTLACIGKSVSLELESRPKEDSLLMKVYFGGISNE